MEENDKAMVNPGQGWLYFATAAKPLEGGLKRLRQKYFLYSSALCTHGKLAEMAILPIGQRTTLQK